MEESTNAKTVYCPDCGTAMAPVDRFCGNCAWDAEQPTKHSKRQPPKSPRNLGTPSDKNRLTTLILCIIAGFMGVHRFYAGRTGSGILWLVTFGVLGVGWIYDIVMIATGEFVDGEGRRVLFWE